MVKRKLSTFAELRERMASEEGEWLRNVLLECGWSVKGAAKFAETGGAQIYKLLRRHPKVDKERERRRRYDERGEHL